MISVPRIFTVKKDFLESKGGEVVEEHDDHVVMVFPDGSGCTLSHMGQVEWFKAV